MHSVHFDWMFHQLIDGVHGLPHPNICLHTLRKTGWLQKKLQLGFEAASNTWSGESEQIRCRIVGVSLNNDLKTLNDLPLLMFKSVPPAPPPFPLCQ